MEVVIKYNEHVDGYSLFIFLDGHKFKTDDIHMLIPVSKNDLTYKYNAFLNTSDDYYGMYFETMKDAERMKNILLSLTE